MPTADPKAIVRRYYDAVINRKDLALVDDLFDAALVFLDPAAPHPLHGSAALQQFLAAFFVGFPDLQFSVDDLFAEGERVAARITATGTHTGELLGIPATGKSFTAPIVEIFHFRDARIAAVWVSFDMLNFMQQIGVIPAPEAVAQ